MSFEAADWYEEDYEDPAYMRVEDHEQEMHYLKESITDLYVTMLEARMDGKKELELECVQDLNKILGVKK